MKRILQLIFGESLHFKFENNNKEIDYVCEVKLICLTLV